MLGLMVWIFGQGVNIPQNRPEIYHECAKLLFETWDARRDIQSNIPENFDLVQLFSFIAHRIFGDIDAEDGVSKEWIRGTCFEYFTHWYESRDKAFEAAKKIADFVCGRAWLISRFGPNRYRFTHRTFLEYFYASEEVAQSETVKKLVQVIKRNLIRSNWVVVGHLALQKRTLNDAHATRAALHLMREAIKERGKSKSHRERRIVFAADSTEYLRGPESEYRLYVRDIMEVTFKQGSVTAMYSTFQSLLRHADDRKSIVIEEYGALLEKCMIEERPSDFALQIFLIQQRPILLEVRPRLLGGGPIKMRAVEPSIWELLGNRARIRFGKMAVGDIRWSRIAVEVGLLDAQESFDRFGYEVFGGLEFSKSGVSEVVTLFDRVVAGLESAVPPEQQSANVELLKKVLGSLCAGRVSVRDAGIKSLVFIHSDFPAELVDKAKIKAPASVRLFILLVAVSSIHSYKERIISIERSRVSKLVSQMLEKLDQESEENDNVKRYLRSEVEAVLRRKV